MLSLLLLRLSLLPKDGFRKAKTVSALFTASEQPLVRSLAHIGNQEMCLREGRKEKIGRKENQRLMKVKEPLGKIAIS